MKKKVAVLSFSGGMDSSSLLFKILSEGYDIIQCYNFDYGQRHSVEIEKSKELVEFLNSKGFKVNYQLINLRDVFSDSQSALGANKTQEVPEDEYKLENLVATVVENRNVIFSSIIYGKALALSKKYDADVDIMMGVHGNDNAVYPDCRPESVNMAQKLFEISNYGSDRIKYKAPFVHSTKSEVLKEGIKSLELLNLDYTVYQLTSSCYNPSTDEVGNVFACGKCATCLDRLEAFRSNDIEDPISYKE